MLAPSTACTVTLTASRVVTANYTTLGTTAYTLTVNTSDPSSGVKITVSPTDNNGFTNGTTPFVLSYTQNTQVTLTAPPGVNGIPLKSWTGCDQPSSTTTCTVTLTASKSVTVSYAHTYTYTNGLGFGPDINGNVWNIWSANGSNVWDWQQNYVGGYLHYAFKVYDYAGFYCSASCRSHNVWDTNPALGFEVGNVLGNDISVFPESNQNNHIYQVDIQWNGGGYHESIFDLTGASAYSADYAYAVNAQTYDSWTWSAWWYGGAYTDENASAHASQWTNAPYGYEVTGTTGGGGDIRTDALPVVAYASAATSAVDFGTVVIGQTGTTIPLTFLFNAEGTLASVAVLTQGVAGLDFANAGTGTCTAGTYAAGSSCTVGVIFTPKFAGVRNGAVVLKDDGGNVIATAYIHGTGSGPQVSFLPGSQSTLLSGFGYPVGVAVDGGGNVFVADGGNNAVYEISAASGYTTVKTLGGGFYRPWGIAVDGSGNVFVADNGNGVVKEIPLGCISYSCVKTLGGTFGFSYYAFGVAVDSSGNVFVADATVGVFEIPAAGGYTTVKALTNGGYYPQSIAVDGSGNVVFDDGNRVWKILAAGDYTTVNLLANNFTVTLAGLAVDGSGNVFFTTQNNDASGGNYTVNEVPSGCTAANCIKALASGSIYVSGLAVDGSGNLYVADTSNKGLVKLDYADGPSLSFATPTLVGSVDTADGPQTVTVQNIGNAPLTFQPFTAANLLHAALPSLHVTDCTELSGLQLAPGASCTLDIEFRPTQSGLVNGHVNVVDNTLNAYATQTIAVQGTGTGSVPAPVVSLSPLSLTFPSQPLNQPSMAQAVTLTNTGNAALTIWQIAPGGDFSQTNNCPASLATNVSCTINVSFTPTATGTSNGTLTITDNAANSPQIVGLNGTGTLPAKTTPTVLVTPSSSSVTTAQTLTVTVTVNGGSSNPTPAGSVTLTSVGYTSPATTLSGGSAAITIAAGLLGTGTER